MYKVLVVANQTIAGSALLDAVKQRTTAHDDTRVIICVPRSNPSHGRVIYDDVVYDAAQIRVDLARNVLRQEGIDAIGEFDGLTDLAQSDPLQGKEVPLRNHPGQLPFGIDHEDVANAMGGHGKHGVIGGGMLFQLEGIRRHRGG